MSDTNQVVQPQKMARGWNFWIKVEKGSYFMYLHVYNENKGANQLDSYCTACLCLCFRIWKKGTIS